jgi:hypothetical protein
MVATCTLVFAQPKGRLSLEPDRLAGAPNSEDWSGVLRRVNGHRAYALVAAPSTRPSTGSLMLLR